MPNSVEDRALMVFLSVTSEQIRTCTLASGANAIRHRARRLRWGRECPQLKHKTARNPLASQQSGKVRVGCAIVRALYYPL